MGITKCSSVPHCSSVFLYSFLVDSKYFLAEWLGASLRQSDELVQNNWAATLLAAKV